MIIPDKHMDLDTSVLRISAYILSLLKIGQEISYDILLEKTIKTLGNNTRENYPYALNFLFLMGTIEYNNLTDSLFRT